MDGKFQKARVLDTNEEAELIVFNPFQVSKNKPDYDYLPTSDGTFGNVEGEDDKE